MLSKWTQALFSAPYLSSSSVDALGQWGTCCHYPHFCRWGNWGTGITQLAQAIHRARQGLVGIQSILETEPVTDSVQYFVSCFHLVLPSFCPHLCMFYCGYTKILCEFVFCFCSLLILLETLHFCSYYNLCNNSSHIFRLLAQVTLPSLIFTIRFCFSIPVYSPPHATVVSATAQQIQWHSVSPWDNARLR